MTQVIKCCAYGCTADPTNSPLNKFYKLTEVRASLTEWLLALSRQEILRQFTKNRDEDNLSICDKHFPSLRTGSPSSDPGRKPTRNTETQTETVPPTLMGTPVEIVDIQPEPLQTSLPINIPTIIPPPNMICAPLPGFLGHLNPDLQNANNNIPSFLSIAPLETMAQTTPVTSQQYCNASILPRILPKFGPSAPYVVNLTNLPPAQSMSIIDAPGLSTATNYMQQCLNMNVPDTNCSVTTSAEEVTGDYDVEVQEDPIKIEDDANNESDGDSDIVKIEFPDGQDPNAEGINLVNETSDDNLETYCFFEDEEVVTKRRRVQSKKSSFQIVKLELDRDRPIT